MLGRRAGAGPSRFLFRRAIDCLAAWRAAKAFLKQSTTPCRLRLAGCFPARGSTRRGVKLFAQTHRQGDSPVQATVDSCKLSQPPAGTVWRPCVAEFVRIPIKSKSESEFSRIPPSA